MKTLKSTEGYFRNLTIFERFVAEILSFSPTSACFLLIHAVRFEKDAYLFTSLSPFSLYTQGTTVPLFNIENRDTRLLNELPENMYRF